LNETLSADEVRALVDYDPQTGRFRYRSGRGKGGTRTKDGYIQLKLGPKLYFAHRVAWVYVHGYWPPEGMDHKSGDRADNRLANLRLANAAENAQNLAPQRGRSSQRSGVTWHKGDQRWQAQIRSDGRYLYLGSYSTEEAAAAAYAAAKARLHEFQPVQRAQQQYGAKCRVDP